MKTRAAVCRKFGAPLEIEEVDLAEPNQGEVRVKIAACAICHSDIFYIEGSWGGQLPAVYGHEAAGVVEAVGPGVTRVKVGDPVVATLIRSCGGCPSCVGGSAVQCEEVFPLSLKSPLTDRSGQSIVHGMGIGAFAEHVVVDQSQIAPVPADMKLDVASLIACGVITGMGRSGEHGRGACGRERRRDRLRRRRPQQHSGRAGRRRGPDHRDRRRRRKARSGARAFGATHTINARSDDVAARVSEITRNRKADFVFVTVGVAGAAEQAISLLGRNGAAVIVGMPPVGVTTTFDPSWLAALGQKVLGSKMGSARLPIDVPRIVELYHEGRLKLDELITGRYRFEEINEAIASSRSGAALRNVVVF